MKTRAIIAISAALVATTGAAVPLDHTPREQTRATKTWESLSDVPCVDGLAGDFHCQDVDLLAYLPLSEMGCGATGNDIWGWTDPITGSEYALMGCNDGTSFVDVTDAKSPVYIGRLPTHTSNSGWRDIKVYADHAYVVSEASGHGLQVFDLTQLRDVTDPPEIFTNTGHLGGFGQAHNVAINEDSGFAYVVGAGRNNPDTCFGGLFMVNIQQPANPSFAGCFGVDGYTHDTQCVIYHGPDENYQGDEICFNSNENTLTIVDVTDKTNPMMLGRETYPGVGYAHQGWLTEDHRFFLLDDECDETSPCGSNNVNHNTRTYIWEVSDLMEPEFIGFYESPTESAIDHNQYIKGNHTYQSNYTSGLRILELTDLAAGVLTEVAYFNVIPHDHDHVSDGLRHDELGGGFNGTWSNYPFFDSGIVIVSTIGEDDTPGGLFVLYPRLAGIDPPGELQVSPLAHDFGEVGAGQVSDLLEVTVSNAAQDPAQTLALTGIGITGDPAFGIGEGSTCDSDTELGPQDSCTIEVFFSPDASGQYDGEISVATGDDQSATIAVSGIGLPPVPAILTVEPAALDFGDVSVGGTATATLTVSNAAEMDADDLLLTQLEVIVGMPVFTRGEGTCAEDTTLAPGQSCTVDIEFTPDTTTVYSGVFRVGSNGGHQDVNLSGGGIEPAPVVFSDRFESE